MSGSPPEVRLRIGTGVTLLGLSGEVGLSPAQQAYLLLLAHAEGDGLRREAVIRLLWGQGEDRSTRHRVRQLNYAVNRKAGATLVEARGTLLALAGSVTVEWAPEAHGASLAAPTPAYQDFLGEVREAREERAALGSVRQLDSARLADYPDEVVRVLREGHRTAGSWRDLLWALLRTGRVREAEFELQRVLGDDVPVEGLPAARRVAAEPERILSLAAAGGDPALPLLGRDPDVRHLNELLLGEADTILITGVHGVGRSRILGQAVAMLLSNEDDVVILGATGMGFERHTPFGGLGQLLNDELLIQAFGELGQPETEIIRRALPVQFESSESHVLAELGGPGSYLRVARAVTELFQRAFGNAEILLVVDDMDQIDRSSLEVMTRLTGVGNARLLGTWCTEGQVTQNELLFRFQGHRPEVVPLRDLELPHAVRLCRAVAPELGPREVEDIARLSGGRPGRIVELIRALKGSPILSGPMGPSLDELLRKRIRELSEPEQRALVFMSANGGHMEVTTLGALLGAGILETSGYLRALEHAGLARLEGSRAAVVPSLLSGFIQRELPPPARQETHATIAAQLMKAPERADPGSIGHHLLESGRPLEAASWFRRAGMAARDRTAYAEAIVYLEKGLASDDQPDPDIAKELGALHAGMGDFRQSIHWYGRARIGYVDRGDRVGDVEAALSSAQSALELHSDRHQLLDEVARLLRQSRVLDESRLIAQALDLWMWIADYGHDWEMLTIGKHELDVELMSRPRDPWIASVGTRFTYLGNPELALRLARTAYLGLRHHPQSRPRALTRLIICLFTQMKPSGRRERVLLRQADKLAFSTGDLYTRYAHLSNKALWSMDRGHWDEAEALLKGAARFIGGPDTVAARRLAVNRALFEIRRGRTLAAEQYLTEIEPSIPTPQASMNALFDACKLLVHLEDGRLGQAAELYAKLGDLDMSFPYGSDLAMVPLARAFYLRRIGKRPVAIALLEAAADGFRSHNPAAARRVRDAIDGGIDQAALGNFCS